MCVLHQSHLFHHGVQRDRWKVKFSQHHGEDLTVSEKFKDIRFCVSHNFLTKGERRTEVLSSPQTVPGVVVL